MPSNQRKIKPRKRPQDRPRASKPDANNFWPEQVMGAKYVRLLEKQLRDLQADNSAEHGNRKLFLDDVFIVYLLTYFNPTLRSLRTIEDFSKTQQAQKHLSVRQICKSTLSDFNQLVDPERLVPIVQAPSRPIEPKAGPAQDRRIRSERTAPADRGGRWHLPACGERSGVGGCQFQ
jgi:hypothetical protein